MTRTIPSKSDPEGLLDGLDIGDAVGIAEGWRNPPGDDDETRTRATLAAWQTLVDTGMAWTLQGWFGRTARALLDEGHILPSAR